jgi:uncharacterized protein
MKLVIDTNGLLSSIPNGSSKRWLYDAFISKKFVWVFSNEILTEYEEMIAYEYSKKAADLVLTILLASSNHEKNEPAYRWQLIEDDPDDNKFFDCAVSANVDFLVSDDHHITKLRKMPNLFPPVSIITFDELKAYLGV